MTCSTNPTQSTNAEASLHGYDRYLNEIAARPLLTHEQEIQYGRVIQKHKKGKTKKRQNAMAQAVRELVEANLRLVVKEANRFRSSSLDIEELTFSGHQGLLVAAERFDPERGFRFSTYATWWIRQSIRLAVHSGHTIRTPIRRAAKLHKIQSAVSYDPSLSPEEMDCRAISRETGMERHEVRRVLRGKLTPLSLDAVLPDTDGSKTLQSAIPSEEVTADEQLDHKEQMDMLKEALTQLDPKQRQVLERRYGLPSKEPGTYEERPHTLDEIATSMGVTRERVRQIQVEAVETLQRIFGWKFINTTPARIAKLISPRG